MDLLCFLKEHTIISVGKPITDECVAVEVILDNPEQLVKTVIKNNCYISEIRWWDRVHISKMSSIGYGGTRDPRFPQNYYFAETDIFQTFEPKTTFLEYMDYLTLIWTQYAMYDLHPSFDIYRV